MAVSQGQAERLGQEPAAPETRTFGQLRLSLTAACNFRCVYCVAEGEVLRPLPGQLPGEQLVAMLGLLRDAGLRKLRLTGGEPLLAPALPEVLAALPQLAFDEVAITTNGALLESWAGRLANGGVGRLNLSLDSLAAEGFAAATRSGELDAVLRGLDAALQAGLDIKVNAVPLRSARPQDWADLLDFCLDKGLELRFIELMRMGHLYGDGPARQRWQNLYVSADEVLQAIMVRHQVQPLGRPAHATAARYAVPGGSFGIIANQSAPFCADCDRLRLTSEGRLFGCITARQGHDMQPLLAMPKQRARQSLDALLGRAMRHKTQSFAGGWSSMRVLGG